MMRIDSFSRAIAFAAGAALVAVPFLLGVAPWLGLRAALSGLLVLLTALYVAGLARRRRGGLGFGVAAIGLGAAWLSPSVAVLAVVLAALLGVLRGAFLMRARPARALVLECLLLGGGLALAQLLAGAGLGSVALALWGFFLIQSLHFLIGGIAPRSESRPDVDPFEQAHARALALLDEEPG